MDNLLFSLVNANNGKWNSIYRFRYTVAIFYNETKSYLCYSLFLLLLSIGEIIELKQLKRATNLLEATFLSGDIEAMHDAEGSGAIRIIPVVNTFTDIDLFNSETWLGKGTQTKEYAADFWKRTTDKIVIVEQYGLISFILSLFLVFRCAIRRFFSIETLIFLGLISMTISNIYYAWTIMMIFTTIKYFDSLHKNDLSE